MRYKEHSSIHIDFPGIKAGITPGKQSAIETVNKTVVINAFPLHPYDYPQIPLLLDLLEKHHHTIKKIKVLK